MIDKRYNYYNLLNIKSKYNILIILFGIFIVFLIMFLSSNKVYSAKEFTCIYQEGYLYLNVPIQDSDTVVKGKFITINNEKKSFGIIEIGKLEQIDDHNYQLFKIEIDDSFKENEIVMAKFYYNKQRIITKIKNVFL